MRLLGIDYGSKRIGVAVSDDGEQFAMPVNVIKNSASTKKSGVLLKEVSEICRKNEVKEIVMGESRDYNGIPNEIYAESLEFKKELETAGFTVYLEPEFMTSANAERFQGKTDMLDASAAALILQSFLDKKRAKR